MFIGNSDFSYKWYTKKKKIEKQSPQYVELEDCHDPVSDVIRTTLPNRMFVKDTCGQDIPARRMYEQIIAKSGF